MAASTGWFRGEGGVIFEMDLPLPEAIAQRVRMGAIRRVAGPDGGDYVPPEEPAQDGSSGDGDPDPSDQGGPAGPLEPPTTRPADSALKPDWVAWAVAKGADFEAASGMTKGDLIERYGQEA